MKIPFRKRSIVPAPAEVTVETTEANAANAANDAMGCIGPSVSLGYSRSQPKSMCFVVSRATDAIESTSGISFGQTSFSGRDPYYFLRTDSTITGIDGPLPAIFSPAT